MKYRDKKAEEWLKGRVWNETRIMRHDSCRLPVTVLVGLAVTVILLSVSQNR